MCTMSRKAKANLLCQFTRQGPIYYLPIEYVYMYEEKQTPIYHANSRGKLADRLCVCVCVCVCV